MNFIHTVAVVSLTTLADLNAVFAKLNAFADAIADAFKPAYLNLRLGKNFRPLVFTWYSKIPSSVHTNLYLSKLKNL